MDKPLYKQQLGMILEMNTLAAQIKVAEENLQYADGQAFYRQRTQRDVIQAKWNKLWNEYKVLTGRVDAPKALTANQLNEQRAAIKNAQSKLVLEEAERARERDLMANKRVRHKLNMVRKAQPKKKVHIMYNEYFYLCECGYATGQMLKKRNPDLKWNPYVQRWYFKVYKHSGQKFEVDSVTKNWLLPAENSLMAEKWSAIIKDELENKPEADRTHTIKIHGTATPKFWKK